MMMLQGKPWRLRVRSGRSLLGNKTAQANGTFGIVVFFGTNE